MDTKLKALGMEFDLVKHQYRMDPEWVDKRSVLLNGALTADWEGKTYRQVFEVYGCLIWAAHVSHTPLWTYAEAIAALSEIAKSVNGEWDSVCVLPKYAYGNLTEWSKRVLDKEQWFLTPSKPETSSFAHQGYSDKKGKARSSSVTESIPCSTPLSTEAPQSSHAPCHKETGMVTSEATSGIEFTLFSDSSCTSIAYVMTQGAMLVRAGQYDREANLDSIYLGECEAVCVAAIEVGNRLFATC